MAVTDQISVPTINWGNTSALETQSLHPQHIHQNKIIAAIIYSLCSNKCARHFLASGSIATADTAFVKLLIGSYHTVTASLYALSLDADRGGIGAAGGTIHNLCRKKAVGCLIRRRALLWNCIIQTHTKYGQVEDLQHLYFSGFWNPKPKKPINSWRYVALLHPTCKNDATVTGENNQFHFLLTPPSSPSTHKSVLLLSYK